MDVVTGLPTPIEIGSLMMDPNSGLPVPILAVTLDNESGKLERGFIKTSLRGQTLMTYRQPVCRTI